MKLFKSLLIALCACALVAGTVSVRADETKKDEKTCCEKAKADGKECTHKCCVAAHKESKSCEKCNPKGQDKPKDDKKK